MGPTGGGVVEEEFDISLVTSGRRWRRSSWRSMWPPLPLCGSLKRNRAASGMLRVAPSGTRDEAVAS